MRGAEHGGSVNIFIISILDSHWGRPRGRSSGAQQHACRARSSSSSTRTRGNVKAPPPAPAAGAPSRRSGTGHSTPHAGSAAVGTGARAAPRVRPKATGRRTPRAGSPSAQHPPRAVPSPETDRSRKPDGWRVRRRRRAAGFHGRCGAGPPRSAWPAPARGCRARRCRPESAKVRGPDRSTITSRRTPPGRAMVCMVGLRRVGLPWPPEVPLSSSRRRHVDGAAIAQSGDRRGPCEEIQVGRPNGPIAELGAMRGVQSPWRARTRIPGSSRRRRRGAEIAKPAPPRGRAGTQTAGPTASVDAIEHVQTVL